MSLAELFGQDTFPQGQSDLSVNIHESHELKDSIQKEKK